VKNDEEEMNMGKRLWFYDEHGRYRRIYVGTSGGGVALALLISIFLIPRLDGITRGIIVAFFFSFWISILLLVISLILLICRKKAAATKTVIIGASLLTVAASLFLIGIFVDAGRILLKVFFNVGIPMTYERLFLAPFS